MGIIIILISISLIIAVGFLLSFLWSLKSGQFDDTYSPSVRMLFEDKTEPQPEPANDEKK
jgi:cbb3-type cytochrome oxidase maturation protein